MSSPTLFASTPANDNSDPYQTAGGAYFDLLKYHRSLLRLDPAMMTGDALTWWQAKLDRIDALLRELRIHL